MGAEDRALIRALRDALAAQACPSQAEAMQRYMKSELPFHGLKAEPLRKTCKQVFSRHPLACFEAFRDTILALYREAEHREERYAAVQLARLPRYRQYLTLNALPMLEEMIVTGAWWDLVDGIAAHLIGTLLRDHPSKMKPLMRRWATHDDIWKRRTAILSQLGFKQDTDLDLLFDCIEPSLGRHEFFLRKAIGWALRQHAWTDPQIIEDYVRRHDARLSPLSKREALKNVKRRRAR